MNIPMALGIILLAGSGGGKLARYLNLPSVTGNLLAGLLVGPSVLNLVGRDTLAGFSPINELALGIIALSIGAEMRWGVLRNVAKDSVKIFAFEAGITFSLVLSLLMIAGVPINLALIFATLGIATAPGAIIACLRENPTKGNFSRALLTVVVFDNLFAIVMFGLITSFLQAGVSFSGFATMTSALEAFMNISVSIFLGILAGIFLVLTSKWAKSDSRILASVLGAIFLTVGLATMFDVPSLLANITAGIIYVNFSKSYKRIEKALFPVEGPIILLFLTLAGAKLELRTLPALGIIGVVYIGARFVGKIAGSRIGAEMTEFPDKWKKNMGKALSPQAGVAIGLAVIAEQKLPFAENTVITVILAAVVVFELVGPILLKRALKECGTGQ